MLAKEKIKYEPEWRRFSSHDWPVWGSGHLGASSRGKLCGRMNEYVNDGEEAIWEVLVLTIVKQRDPFLRVKKTMDTGLRLIWRLGNMSWPLHKEERARQKDESGKTKSMAFVRPVQVFPEKPKWMGKATSPKSKKKSIKSLCEEVSQEEVSIPIYAGCQECEGIIPLTMPPILRKVLVLMSSKHLEPTSFCFYRSTHASKKIDALEVDS